MLLVPNCKIAVVLLAKVNAPEPVPLIANPPSAKVPSVIVTVFAVKAAPSVTATPVRLMVSILRPPLTAGKVAATPGLNVILEVHRIHYQVFLVFNVQKELLVIKLDYRIVLVVKLENIQIN